MYVKGHYLNPAGFVGFVGLLGVRFAWTESAIDLFCFSFLGFFSFFVLGKLNRELPDERFRANELKASQVAFFVSACALFLTGFIAASSFASRELIVLAAVLGWNLTLFAHAIAFRFLESR